MEDKIKITLECYGKTYIHELPDGSDIDEMMTELVILAQLITYHPKSIEAWILEAAEELSSESD